MSISDGAEGGMWVVRADRCATRASILTRDSRVVRRPQSLPASGTSADPSFVVSCVESWRTILAEEREPRATAGVAQLWARRVVQIFQQPVQTFFQVPRAAH